MTTRRWPGSFVTSLEFSSHKLFDCSVTRWFECLACAVVHRIVINDLECSVTCVVIRVGRRIRSLWGDVAS